MDQLTGYSDIRQCDNDNTQNQFVCGWNTSFCKDTFVLPLGFVKDKRPLGESGIIQAAECAEGVRQPGEGNGTYVSSNSPSSSTAGNDRPCQPTIAIGVGVGIGIGVPLLAALGIVSWLLVRARRKIEELNKGYGCGASEPNAEFKGAQQSIVPAELGNPETGSGPYEVSGLS